MIVDQNIRIGNLKQEVVGTHYKIYANEYYVLITVGGDVTLTANTWLTLTTIPEQFRPVTSHYFQAGSYGNLVAIINASGTLQCRHADGGNRTLIGEVFYPRASILDI